MNCQRTECGGRGEWHPVLKFHAPKRYGNAHIPVTLGLILCEACMSAQKVADLCSEALVEMMTNVAKGMGWVPFDFSRTTVGRTRAVGDGSLDAWIAADAAKEAKK